MASFSMEMLFFGLEVLKDSFVQSTLGLDFEQVRLIRHETILVYERTIE